MPFPSFSARPALLSVILLVGCGAPSGYDGLEARISSRVARVPGAVVGVYLKDLLDERTFAWNADTVFHAASTMKIPVMIEVFRAYEDGRLTRDARLHLQNRFASIVDGSPYALDPGDDSDSAMYGRLGTDVPVRDLVERMITRSSNLATNAVIELVGAAKAQATARSLGAATMMVRRGVEDDKAFEKGLNNTTTARDLGVLLEAIALDRAASPDRTREMLAILERQEFNDEIPAGLPRGTRVAHKTGQITGVLHDAAIVFPPEGRAPFILVVLTRGVPDEAVARGIIQDVAGYAWEAVVGR
jgi:beta-lactamase class A